MKKCTILVECLPMEYTMTKDHHNAKCVMHKFYYILTFKIQYYDIASDKMQNALCNIAFPFWILYITILVFNNASGTYCITCPIQIVLLYYYALFMHLLSAYTIHNQ